VDALALTPSPSSAPSLSDRSPAAFYRNYAQFSEWVDRSLDLFHPELHLVLWPLFVHCFIGIVSGSAPRTSSSIAKEFFEKFSHAFTDTLPMGKEGKEDDHVSSAGVSLGGEYANELRHLRSITCREHLELSSLIKSYKLHKYTVCLSRQTYEIFLLYLQEASLFLLSSIVNAHIHPRIVARTPQEMDAEHLYGGGDLSGLTGILPGKQDEMQKRPGLLWGVLDCPQETKKMIVDEVRDATFVRSQINLPRVTTHLFSSCLFFIQLKLGYLRYFLMSLFVSNPMQMSEREELQRLEDLRHRVRLNSKCLPSICFFTLLNSHDRSHSWRSSLLLVY
jgi:transcription initiation factor TFIID subunit 5